MTRTRYIRYIALERSGWIEYGFYPLSLVEDAPRVYYARVVANIIGFLRFVKQLVEQQGIESATL